LPAALAASIESQGDMTDASAHLVDQDAAAPSNPAAAPALEKP